MKRFFAIVVTLIALTVSAMPTANAQQSRPAIGENVSVDILANVEFRGMFSFGTQENRMSYFSAQSIGPVVEIEATPWGSTSKPYREKANDVGIFGPFDWKTVSAKVKGPYNVNLNAYWNDAEKACRKSGLTFYYYLRPNGVNSVIMINTSGRKLRNYWLSRYVGEIEPGGVVQYEGKVIDLQPTVEIDNISDRWYTCGGLFISPNS